jgi:hypothetical protein
MHGYVISSHMHALFHCFLSISSTKELRTEDMHATFMWTPHLGSCGQGWLWTEPLVSAESRKHIQRSDSGLFSPTSKSYKSIDQLKYLDLSTLV